MHNRPDAKAWADRWGLKRQGREYSGACPLCGGVDRFSVKDKRGKPGLVYCRGCEAGYIDLLRAVFPERFNSADRTETSLRIYGTQRSEFSRKRARTGTSQRPKTEPATPTNRNRAAAVKAVWQSGQPIAGTPAELYLNSRALGDAAKRYPSAVRWLPSTVELSRVLIDETASAGQLVTLYRLTKGRAAGAVLFSLYCFATGKGQAVALEAVTGAGQLLAERYRRTWGDRRGAGLILRPTGSGNRPLVICEGEATALACSVRPGWQGCEVRAAGGTGVLEPACYAGVNGRRVIIAADNDKPGLKAARALLRELTANRIAGEIERPKEGGKDFADLHAKRCREPARDGGN